ncbi:MAG: helix-turn-helix transcriptional regulator [Patescibacteria group bacterium]|jgi:hypothetical protein
MRDITNLGMYLETACASHATPENPLKTVHAQAKFLGVSAPQLSRLRRGEVPLTRKSAVKFSQRLGCNDDERERIRRELLAFLDCADNDRHAAIWQAVKLQIPIGKIDLGMLP